MKSKILISIVVILLLGTLGAMFYELEHKIKPYQKSLEKENQVLKEENTKTNKKDENIVGIYTATKEYDNAPSVTVSLELTPTGEFYIKTSSTMASWSYGTYEIKEKG